MNVWMKIEESALNDPRIRLLAKRMSASYGDAFYACCVVWQFLYKNAGRTLTHEEIDAAADIDGFADLFAGVGLAEVTSEGLRVKGNKRVRELNALNSLKKPLDSVSQKTKDPIPPPRDAYIDLDLSGSGSESDPDPDAREAAEWLEWFNREFKRKFELRAPLIRNVRALRKAGFTQEDMRKVSLLKKEEWEGKADMSRFLTPASLLRIGTFGDYLDRARESISSRQTGFQGLDAPRVPYVPKKPVLAIVEDPVSRDEVRNLVGDLTKILKGGSR